MQRKSTYFNMDEEPPVPEGLTSQQQQAAALLASGMAVKEVAERLDVHRSTLWHWRQLETFQAYLNALRKEAAQDAAGGLIALQRDALETISRVMAEGSDASALKAACYVLDQTSDMEIGPIDPRTILRSDYTTEEGFGQLLEGLGQKFDEEGYRKHCEELGIEP